MAGPRDLLQRLSVDQELGLLKAQGLTQSLAPVLLSFCAWWGILSDFTLDSGILFSTEKGLWGLSLGGVLHLLLQCRFRAGQM